MSLPSLRAVIGALIFGVFAIAHAQTISVWQDCEDCPSLVSVPAGEFTMGAELAESKA